MKALLYSLVFVLALTFAPKAAAQTSEITPPPGYTKIGCDAEGYADGSFHVHVWAKYGDPNNASAPGHKWIVLYAIHMSDGPVKNRSEAIADCDRWMKQAEKAQPKQQSKQKKAKAGTEPDSSHGKRKAGATGSGAD